MNCLVKWTPRGGQTIEQKVQYKKSSDSEWITHSILPKTDSSVTIEGLEDNILYDFRTISVCGAGGDAPSGAYQEINIICPNLQLSSTESSVTVSFQKLSGSIDKYKLLLFEGTSQVSFSENIVSHQDSPATIQVVFPGLSANTNYRVGVVVCTPYEICQKNCGESTVRTKPKVVPTLTFKYGTTLADTTEDLLTEAEYLASVEETFQRGEELTGQVDNNGNVIVQDFMNGNEDKVLFVQVDKNFTVWSEIENVFQQNLPIDPNYATGQNVWFKSHRNGVPIYITRSQTSIAGSLKLG